MDSLVRAARLTEPKLIDRVETPRQKSTGPGEKIYGPLKSLFNSDSLLHYSSWGIQCGMNGRDLIQSACAILEVIVGHGLVRDCGHRGKGLQMTKEMAAHHYCQKWSADDISNNRGARSPPRRPRRRTQRRAEPSPNSTLPSYNHNPPTTHPPEPTTTPSTPPNLNKTKDPALFFFIFVSLMMRKPCAKRNQ